MRKSFAWGIILFAIAIGSGCESRQESSPTITVSIQPLKYIVEAITGNDFPISVLLPPGSSPENYEPSPQQLIEVSRSGLLFTTGLIGFEQSMVERIGQGEHAPTIVDLSERIDPIQSFHSHGTHKHLQGNDPHIWTSLRNLKTMAETAYGQIALHYPDSLKYQWNFEKLVARLDSLDQTIQTILSASGVQYFLVFHPAFSYYARDYGLTQIALENEGKEPSVEQLQAVIDLARREKIDKILYQSEFPRSTVEVVAREIGARPIEVDILGEQITDNLLFLTEQIATP